MPPRFPVPGPIPCRSFAGLAALTATPRSIASIPTVPTHAAVAAIAAVAPPQQAVTTAAAVTAPALSTVAPSTARASLTERTTATVTAPAATTGLTPAVLACGSSFVRSLMAANDLEPRENQDPNQGSRQQSKLKPHFHPLPPAKILPGSEHPPTPLGAAGVDSTRERFPAKVCFS